MEKYLDKIVNALVDFGGKLVVAGLLILVGFKIVSVVVNKIKKGRGFVKLEKSSQTFLASIISLICKSLILITAVAIIGIPMTSIIAVIGSAGLALGLALQGGLSNIAGGVMIMIFKPFRVGNYIETEDNAGVVKEINIFNTVLETLDHRFVVIPNGNLSNSVVVNYTAMQYADVEILLSVSYDSDIDKVKKVINDVAISNKYYLNDEKKPNYIVLSKHDQSSLEFKFRMWVKSEDYWNAKFLLLEEFKKAFDKNKIKIPFPQLDVHLDK